MSEVPTGEPPVEGSPENDDEDRQQRYASYREETAKRHLSNAENFDKAILTYSSAGLAFSLGFVKDFVPVESAAQLWMLYSSWVFFTTAIALVILSYPISQKVLDIQLDRAQAYYVERQDEVLDETSKLEIAARWINTLSGAAFLAALILTTLFVFINFGGSKMADTKARLTQDGAINLSMQKQPQQDVQKGATSLPIQRITPVPAPVQQPQPPTTGTGTTGKK
jgi:hypothetical protein